MVFKFLEISLSLILLTFSTENKVYICKGPKSKAYHYKKNCMGLKSCSTNIFEITLDGAINLGRVRCGIEK